jgi:uncharacterized phage protein (TIGR02218 family)
MTYEIYEESVESSRPIELYTFSLGGVIWRYTSSPIDVVVASLTYTAIAIDRGDIAEKHEEQDALVEVTMDASMPLPQKFIQSVPGKSVGCTISRAQDLDTTPGPRQVITLFEGVVESVAFGENGRVARLAIRALTSAFSKQIPRQTYSGVCNHVLYSTRCKVLKSSYDLPSAAVTVISGRTITVTGASGQPDGYWEGGYVEKTDLSDRRLVLAHVGNVLTLPLAFAELIVTDQVNVYAGCKHDKATCNTKFSNIANFGGFPYIPKKNVFETGI